VSTPAAPTGTSNGAAGLDRAVALVRPSGRDLAGPELREVVQALSSAPALWRALVRHVPEQRLYRELLSEKGLPLPPSA